MASTRYSWLSWVVTIKTLACGHRSLIARVAANPSILGMRTSMSTRSGHSFRQNSRASSPSAASPTISRSGSLASIDRIPSLARAWSSAISTRAGELFTFMTVFLPIRLRQRDLRHHGGASAGLAADLKLAAEQRDPLPHAGEPHPLPRAAHSRCRARVEPAPVVPNLQAYALPAPYQRDLGPGGCGVLARVGERLVGDPVERGLDVGWHAFTSQPVFVTDLPALGPKLLD